MLSVDSRCLAFVLLAAFPLGNLMHTPSDDVAAHWEDSRPLAELREDHPYLGSPMDVFRENAFAIPPHIWSNLHGPESSGVRFLGDMLFAYGSTALGYGAGIVLLGQRQSRKSVLPPLQNLGRMALTVYLCRTVVFTTLFYGWGFGQLFLLGPAVTTFYAVLFFLTLLAFCTWWLARYRFGPAEWVWRSLTYLKLQPLSR